MSYLKFHLTRTPSGQIVLARLFAGPTAEEAKYAGTLALPEPIWEQLLDCLVYGASEMYFGDERLCVFFGPDDGGG